MSRACDHGRAWRGLRIRNDLNKFNPSLKRGYRLSRWFAREFGSTQCRDITQCNFATAAGVDDYITNYRIVACQSITEKVAAKVERMIAAEEGGGSQDAA